MTNFSMKGVVTRLESMVAALDAHGPAILLVGFSTLLLLVGFTGYWSQRSFQQVDRDVSIRREGNAHRAKIVFQIGEVFDEMAPEVRTSIAERNNPLLYGPSRRRLGQLKRKMDAALDEGRKSSLGSMAEFRALDASFSEFWADVASDDAISTQWSEDREKFFTALSMLQKKIRLEGEQSDKEVAQISARASTRVGFATIVVLLVGLAVTALAYFEIHRILKRLSNAYSETSDSRDYLDSLLNSIVSGVVVVESDGTVSSANKPFLERSRIGIARPIGLKYEEVFKERPALVQAISERLAEESQNHDYCTRVEAGRGRLFDVFASPLAIAGRQAGLIVIFVDVTDVERAQIELRRNRALSAVGQMTAQVAHEIKNPLGSIGLALDLLKRRSPDKSTEEMDVIGVIERSVDHLREIVTELLEFTRPKALRRTSVSLSRLIEEILPMVADRTADKQIAIEKCFGEDVPSCECDEAELRKLLINLVINAIDASQVAGVIEIVTALDHGGMVQIAVRDHGCGMDAETLRRLYEPFYTTKAKGTGLGMAIAKQIVELHRGDILVTSEKGNGTTVAVRIPSDSSGAIAAQARQPQAKQATSQQLVNS
ncbi:MAG TPA: ATP-binding protein [Blastocatellia bacterium]|nr:ATP-binding protein [Blastocatellia bacterium]